MALGEFNDLKIVALAGGVGGAKLAHGPVHDALQLPDRWVAQALILAGIPDEAPAGPAGRALDEVVQWR